MAIYSKGKKVKSIYVRGKAVGKVFTRGKSVYENYPQLLGAMRLDITSNNSNSVSGYMTFAKYLDFDKELNMEIIRYETALKELKNFEGVVNLVFPEDCIILVNGLRMSTANKKAVISGQELNGLNGFITTNNSWSDSLTATSDYIQPIRDLTLGSAVGFLTVSKGFCIAANNRDSRLSLNNNLTQNLNSIGVTKDGTYSVYAVSTTNNVENDITIISCDPNIIQASSLFRHIGWLTKTGNNFSVVSFGSSISGSQFSKSANSPNVLISGGWGNDTSGHQMSVASATIDCSADITSVTKENTTLIKSKKNTSTAGSSGMTISGISCTIQFTASDAPKGAMRVKITGGGTRLGDWTGHSEWTLYNTSTNQYTPGSKKSNTAYVDIPTGSVLTAAYSGFSGSPVGTKKDVTYTTYVYKVTYNPTIIKKLYYHAVYDKNSENVTSSIVSTGASDTTPVSTPYDSYTLLGTLTVETETGNLSIV